MIDFHSHIIPHFDDGAKNTGMSMEMLRISAEMGIDTVVSTSHFYPNRYEDAMDFVRERDSLLKGVIKAGEGKKIPEIVLGAEVYVDKNISKKKNLRSLCIGGTDYIMLEMPYDKWEEDDFEEIYQITRMGLRPVMAHLDRYMKYKKQFGELFSLGVAAQINAASVLNPGTRHDVLTLFDMDAAHVLGSDMHNIDKRPPNAAQAYDAVEKKFGADYRRFLQHNAEKLLKNEALSAARLHKITGIKRLFV